jgi:hypothetical protein
MNDKVGLRSDMGMSEDGDEIAAEARRLIRENEINPQRFLRALDEGWYTEAELSELPAEQRVLLVPALQAMLPNRTGRILLNVAQALLELGDPLGWQTFRECLSGDDAALCLGALERLIKLPHDPQKRGYKAPIDADAVIEALERPLASARQQPDPRRSCPRVEMVEDASRVRSACSACRR